MLSPASDKAKFCAEFLSKISNLDDSDISLLAFPSRTNLQLHNIPVTSKLNEEIITDLYPSKASCTDCIPVVVLKNYVPEFSYIIADLFNICVLLQEKGQSSFAFSTALQRSQLSLTAFQKFDTNKSY